jgi:subtilase family serine protease
MTEKNEQELALELAVRIAKEAIVEATTKSTESVTRVASAAVESIRVYTAAITVVQNDITNIKEDVKDIKETIKNDFITEAEFDPVKKVVYGLVALILVAVVGALIALVLK